jgi:hypothetical protein
MILVRGRRGRRGFPHAADDCKKRVRNAAGFNRIWDLERGSLTGSGTRQFNRIWTAAV